MTPPAAIQTAKCIAKLLGCGQAGQLAAQALVEAELRGEHGFGFDLLRPFPDTAALKLPDLAGDDAIRRVDATGTFGPLIIAAAVMDIRRRANHHGVSALFLTGVAGFGRQAPYLRWLADQGLAAIMAAQGPPIVAPPGGHAPAIGTNPVGFAIGTGDAQFVIDMATSRLTMRDLRLAAASGASLPEAAALDAHGQPTSSAEDARAIMPRGTAGAMLGLMVELLAGIAPAGPGQMSGRGVWVAAIDLPRLEPGVAERLAAFARHWQAAGGRLPGLERPDLSQPLAMP